MRKIQVKRGDDKKIRESKMQRMPKHSNTDNIGNNRSMLHGILNGMETRTEGQDIGGGGKDNTLPTEVTAEYVRSLPFRTRMMCLGERIKWLQRARKQDKINLRKQLEVKIRFGWTKKGLCHNCSEHNPIINKKRGICKSCLEKEKKRWREFKRMKQDEKAKRMLRLQKKNQRRNAKHKRNA